MMPFLGTCAYLEEFHKLDFNDRQESSDNELGFNKLGYFMLNERYLDSYENTFHLSNIYYTNKIHIFGSYSYVSKTLETLITNHFDLQLIMLDIEINNWDSMSISWDLLAQFTNLKLLYIDGNNASRNNKYIPDITAHLPPFLEALSIVNMPYYNETFSSKLSNSNLKIIKLFALKFNKELNTLPPILETLIIESGEFNQRIDNLPSSLKHLILLCPKFIMPLECLPHGLKYFAGLYFNCFSYPEDSYKLELVNLPSSIELIMLDKLLYDKQHNILSRVYKNCQIEFYEDINNFEFILNNLISTIE